MLSIFENVSHTTLQKWHSHLSCKTTGRILRPLDPLGHLITVHRLRVGTPLLHIHMDARLY